MYWDISQSTRNPNTYRTFDVTWIRADESVLFSSTINGGADMFPNMDLGDGNYQVVKPLFLNYQ
jgi:hypothetical protein